MFTLNMKCTHFMNIVASHVGLYLVLSVCVVAIQCLCNAIRYVDQGSFIICSVLNSEYKVLSTLVQRETKFQLKVQHVNFLAIHMVIKS